MSNVSRRGPTQGWQHHGDIYPLESPAHTSLTPYRRTVGSSHHRALRGAPALTRHREVGDTVPGRRALAGGLWLGYERAATYQTKTCTQDITPRGSRSLRVAGRIHTGGSSAPGCATAPHRHAPLGTVPTPAPPCSSCLRNKITLHGASHLKERSAAQPGPEADQAWSWRIKGRTAGRTGRRTEGRTKESEQSVRWSDPSLHPPSSQRPAGLSQRNTPQ